MSVKVHEAFSMDSFIDRLLWFDDFHGDQIQDEWDEAGVGSAAVIDAQTGGIVRLTTGATSGDSYTLDWADFRSLLVTKKATIEFRVKAEQATYIYMYLSLYRDGANYATFYLDEGAGGAINWFAICRDGGISTSEDTGEALDAFYHIFRIECHTHGASHVHFYIDGMQTTNSPITTNIPDDGTDYLQPYFRVGTREDATRYIDIDYVYVRQER